MFGGYADVAAYTVDQEKDGYVGLPPEFLPMFEPSDPWHRQATFDEDFVIIAEFSEQEGPKPLITIPKDAGGSFDQNAFVVKIMSVDHQTASGTFRLTEDTQVVLSENREKAFAYVHHFTLHDTAARGFVRPFCMAYVTADKEKPMSFYEEMSAEFQKVSDYFKYGNHMLFGRDLEHHLADLKFTKTRFLERNGGSDSSNPEEDLIFQSVSEQSLETNIADVKYILSIINSLLTDKRIESRFQSLEERARLNQVLRGDAGKDTSSYDDSSCSPDGNISPHSKLKRSSTYSDFDESLFSLIQSDEPYQPKLVRTVNKRRFDTSLRSLHELCHWGAKEGVNRIRCLHKYFCRDVATLRMEKKDSALIDPHSTLLTVGRNVHVNFLSGIGQSPDSLDWGHLNGDDGSFRLSPSTTNLLKRWQSSDTMASFKSAESFLSTKDDASSLMSARSNCEPTFVLGSAYIEEGAAAECESLGDSNDLVSSDDAEDSVFYEAQSELPAAVRSASLGSSEQGIHHILNESSCPSGQDARRLCVAVVSPADHVTNLNQSSPGYGVLQLMNQYPFCIHLLYSLLCGRPVVVLGPATLEKEIRAAVTALWLFVPGHNSLCHSVIPWHQKPIKITDLTHMKLVGVMRPEKRTADYMVPNSVRRYVTVLDIQKRTLWSPSYQGGLISNIVNIKKHFKADEAYVAYIHSVLMEVAMKAYVYYHAYCLLGNQDKQYEQGDGEECAVSSTLEFLGLKLGINAADSKVVQYFAEMIKIQQVMEYRASSSVTTDVSPVSVHLDLQQCCTFKC